MSSWTKQSELIFGMIQVHPNNHFIDNGHYNITYCGSHQKKIEFRMDFISMSRCIVREGQHLWLVLDEVSCNELAALGLEPSTSDVTLFQAMQSILYDGHTSQLAVYYVLGGTEQSTHPAQATINVGVIVKGEIKILNVAMYDSEGNARLARFKDETLHQFSELSTCSAMKYDDQHVFVWE